MQEVLLLLGGNIVIIVVGIIAFMWSFKYSEFLFRWIEDQTFGTRDYILQKLELLQKDVKEEKITYVLLFMLLGPSFIFLGMFSIFRLYFWGLVFFLFFFVVGWKSPRKIMDMLVERRIKKFNGQFVDGLNLLSNGLRAGLSVPQSLAMVVDELPAPLSEEFNLILQQNKIGSSLEECFDEFAKRIPTDDVNMFVTSVNILRETGGNLAEVFDTIAFVVRERVRLQQKIDTYVAQGKMQGGVIFCMPTAMGTIFAISDPASMAPMFTHPLGLVLLFVAALLNFGGGYAMWKVIQIKL